MAQAVAVASVCKPAPMWTAEAVMPDKSIKKISLQQYAGKWVVFFAYPLDMTFVCPTEIIAFSEKASEFRKVNAEVIGFSVDSVFAHLTWVEMDRKKGGLGQMNIPLVSDLTHNISRAYGCMLESEGHTCRATYIIDPKGVVRHVSMNDPPVGRNVDEVLRLVQGYQFADQHGEVCPASWHPGAATIKPNPVDKVEYFGKAN